MIRAHINAVMALIQADTSIRVYNAIVPGTPALPYAVLFAGPPGAIPTALDGLSTWRQFRFHINCVGGDAQQVFALVERIETRLLDVTPTVAGRSTGPITKTLETPQPVQRDDDVSPAVLYSTDIWEFSSVPA